MIEARVDRLEEQLGTEGAVSHWFAVGQERIDRFADATDDHQWLHVDQKRARKESPYETTIAHGFLTLSLIGTLLRDAVSIDGTDMAVNYGVDRVRFTAAVPAGSRIRGRFRVKRAAPARGAMKVVWSVTVERESDERPCCVADWTVLYYRNE